MNSDSSSPKGKGNFLQQVDLYWIYCPYDVITKIYSFLKTVETSTSTDDQMKEALGEVMLAIRIDF